MTQSYNECFVCGARFIDSDPPGKAMKELHHVIPRAYGGTNGPLVALCSECHTKVHKLATRYDQSLFNGLNSLGKSRLEYLARSVYNAKHITKSDPNKLLQITFKLTKEEAAVLDHLKSVLNVKSRADVYHIALKKLYSNLLA